MLTEQLRRYHSELVEGAVLLATAPFLLFPSALPPLTVLALLALGTVFLLGLLAPRRVPFPTTPFNLPLLLFWLMVATAVLVSADPDLTLPKVTGLLLGMAVWRVAAVYARPPRLWQIGMLLFLLAGLGFTALGLLNANWLAKTASGLPLLDQIQFLAAWQRLPLAGAEGGIHPNQTAAAIVIYLPLLLVVCLWATRRRARGPLIAGWLAFAFGLLGLLLTQSRSGWLGALAGFGLLGLLWWLAGLPPRPRRRWVPAVAVALTLLLFGGFWALMRSDALAPAETIVGSTSTINFRLAVWPWALETIRAFAFTGTGLGAFRAAGPRLFPINVPPETDFAHAHSQLLQTALDVGLPGLVAYVALLLVAATVGWRVAVTHRTLRPFALGLLAGLAGLHVYGLTDALALGAKPGVLLWGALGLLAAVAGDALNDHGR